MGRADPVRAWYFLEESIHLILGNGSLEYILIFAT